MDVNSWLQSLPSSLKTTESEGQSSHKVSVHDFIREVSSTYKANPKNPSDFILQDSSQVREENSGQSNPHADKREVLRAYIARVGVSSTH